jgi:hypothetical protein
MKNAIALGAMLVCISVVHASELTFEFKSPAFSGIGYSSHILTIEQLETNRKRQNRDDAQAELDRLDRERKNTNAYKFQNNLESRIYAQLSRQITDRLFSDTCSDPNTTTCYTEGEWVSSETPFGDTIRWRKYQGEIFVEIYERGQTVDIDTPSVSFKTPLGGFTP